VKPSVLQGEYNLLARKSKEELLPVLRKHCIAYYAYSWVLFESLCGVRSVADVGQACCCGLFDWKGRSRLYE
jgi:aryl-alcohol dehydrogenase-like predicted oxidoreductase